MESIKVLVCEDDTLTRLGLILVLNNTGEFKVIGEASDGQEAIAQALRFKPNLILMDVALPVLDGLEACRRIKSSLPQAAILMLSSHFDKQTVDDSLEAGADAYCSKEISDTKLAQIMKDCANHQLTARVWS
jgi:DNA-binding NarL/FixJ family response regulator